MQVKTLAQQVRAQLLWLGLGFTVAAVLLLLVFSWRSMEITSNSLMWLEAESLARNSAQNNDYVLPRSTSFSAYRYWLDIPVSVRQHFTRPPAANSEIAEAVIHSNSGAEYLFLLHYSQANEQDLWLLSRHSDTEIERFFNSFLNHAIEQALWFTALVFTLLFLLCSWLIRRTTSSIATLSQWAKTLASEPDSNIEFSIAELNTLAQHLRLGVEQVREFNQREKFFLQSASHELRTPLAILQASLDTAELLATPRQLTTLGRAQKASAKMRQLIATLLWLARHEQRTAVRQTTDVVALCQQLLDDHRDLIHGDAIDIEILGNPTEINIEREALEVAVANLIRNACQHSASGTIEITVSVSHLTVANAYNQRDSSNQKQEKEHSPDGIGLGLQLVERICAQLNWSLHCHKTHNRFTASLHWLPDQENSAP